MSSEFNQEDSKRPEDESKETDQEIKAINEEDNNDKSQKEIILINGLKGFMEIMVLHMDNLREEKRLSKGLKDSERRDSKKKASRTRNRRTRVSRASSELPPYSPPDQPPPPYS